MAGDEISNAPDAGVSQSHTNHPTPRRNMRSLVATAPRDPRIRGWRPNMGSYR
jgi:hypothetical protein